MKLSHLRLENVRNIETLELDLAPGINIFTGANGAGKTSVLEGVFVLAHARSFRSGAIESLIRYGARHLSSYGRVDNTTGNTQLGLLRRDGRWEPRVNGERPAGLNGLLQEVCVVCFEPGSHALLGGSSAVRRAYLDWGVFHVEPRVWSASRRYLRALRQRNAALKSHSGDADLDAWDFELAQTGSALNAYREQYVQSFRNELVEILGKLLPELGQANFRYTSGWDTDASLNSSLGADRSRDRARGFTGQGPHRANWRIEFAHAPTHEHLSRGQEKLCALACVLAQGRQRAKLRGDWPIVCLDDLASELDHEHQRAVAQRLVAEDAQVLVTGTEIPRALQEIAAPMRRFHVEQGSVSALL